MAGKAPKSANAAQLTPSNVTPEMQAKAVSSKTSLDASLDGRPEMSGNGASNARTSQTSVNERPANAQDLPSAQDARQAMSSVEGQTQIDIEVKGDSNQGGLPAAAKDQADAGSQQDPSNPEPDGNGGDLKDSQNRSGRESWVKAKLREKLGVAWDNPTKTILSLGAISVAAWALHLGILTDQNNGAKIRVLSIKVKPGSNNNNTVTITYDPNDAKTRSNIKISPDYVSPAINDAILFDNTGNPPGHLGSTKHRIKKCYDTMFDIEISDSLLSPNLPNVSTSCGSPNPPCFSASSNNEYVLDLSGGNYYMTLTTSYGNQFAQNIFDNLLVLSQILVNIANASAPVLSALAGAGAGAGKAAFCTVMPLFCDSTIWLVVLIGVVAMIIFVAVS